MKRTAALLTLSFSPLFLAILLLPKAVFAESKTTVNVESNTGGNTICVNGKCTTTGGGNSTSKVCVNGVCHTNENGDVNYQSEDGNTKVNIKNNSGPSVSVQQDTNGSVRNNVNVTSDNAAIQPTVKQEVQGIKDELQAKKKEIDAKKFDFMKFIENELASIKKLFTLDFLFGKKE